MSLFIHDSGSWKELFQGDAKVKSSSAIKDVQQIWVKKEGVWFPTWGYTPSTSRYARWGIAQFSDVDFLGGKENPNQAGDDYTVWTGVQDFIDSSLTNVESIQSSMSIAANIPFPLYCYLATPLEYGLANFIDDENGFPGGWDGIHWPDGSYTEASGPKIVTYDDGNGASYWFVYRTNYSGIGPMSWSIDFTLI